MMKQDMDMTESPDSMAKKTVQTLPSIEDETGGVGDHESLALPEMNSNHQQAAIAEEKDEDASVSTFGSKPAAEEKEVAKPQVFLKMDVTGFRIQDLHVEVDTSQKRLSLAAKAPRMFKRNFPLKADNAEDEDEDLPRLEARVVLDEEGRQFLVIQSCLDKDDNDDDVSSLSSTGMRPLTIQDDTRPPTMISIPGNN
jgi:HSP20 family molecular chaperone IbpA